MKHTAEPISGGAAPLAPAELTANPTSPTAIELTWADESSNESSFQILRRAVDAAKWTVVKTLTANAVSYTDANLQAGTEYVYQVVAKNSSGTSMASGEATATTMTLPAAASDLVATTVSAGTIQLAWSDNSDDETGFEVLRRSGTSGYKVIATLDADSTTFSDTTLKPATKYTYEIVAVKNGAGTAPSNIVTASTMPLPTAPNALAAKVQSPSSIQLTWNDRASNETGYRIMQKMGSTWSVVQDLAANATGFLLTGLTANTTYAFEVLAVNDTKTSVASNVATTKTTPLPATMPGSINASVGTVSATGMQLIWNASGINQSGFQVQRKDPNTGLWASVVSLDANANSYTDQTVDAGTTYSYQVIATTDGAISSISGMVAGTTLPATPTGVTASQLTTTSVQLHWSENSTKVTGFKILRKTSSTGWTTVQTVGAGVFDFTDMNLQQNVTYSYEVQALNGSGVSAMSDAASTTTLEPPAAVTGAGATVLPSSQILLNWTDNSTTESGFKISRSSDGVHFTTIATTAANATGYTDTTVAALTTYYYLVVATNTAGDAGPSNMVNATTLSSVAGVTLDANGWTQVTAPSDARIIYVSSSQGNDANDGLTPNTPVQSLAAGYNLLRDGYPDELLLKRGDTWTKPLGAPFWNSPDTYGFNKGGRSASEPMVVSAYGVGARPVISSGTQQALSMVSGATHSHLFIQGLDFEGTGGGYGIKIAQPGSDYLVENCVVSGFVDNMEVMETTDTGLIDDVRIRRCIIENSNGAGKSQGLYAYGINHLLLEGNLFYHNGWSADGSVQPTIFSHNAYTDALKNFVARDNVFADGSSFGLTVSGDVTGDTINPLIENNLFIGDGNSLVFGAGSQYTITGAVVRGNVFTQIGRTISGNDQSYGIDVGSADGVTIENNLFFNKSDKGTSFLVKLGDTRGYKNITIQNNTASDWAYGFIWLGTSVPFQNVQIKGNILQDSLYGSYLQLTSSATQNPQVVYSNNTYSSNATTGWFSTDGGNSYENLNQWTTATGETGATTGPVQFVNGNVTAGSYAASLNLGSDYEALLTAMAGQSQSNWQNQLTTQSILAYLKAGFTVKNQ